MNRSELGLAKRTLVLGIVEVLLVGALGATLVIWLRGGSGATSSASTGPIPAADFNPNTWGYVGCSNTHDTIAGYQEIAGSQHLFWPFRGYGIEGKTVPHWEDGSDPVWMLFDRMKQQYNGGGDPPVIWIQFCVNLNSREPNYGPVGYDDVVKMIQQVKAHSPSSILFVSPLQSYDPPTLCGLMGPNGDEIPQMTTWLTKAVSDGLTRPGPGVSGIPNLGPLTSTSAFRDGCHPSGGPHGPGPGVDILGTQLAKFFDNLPRS